MSNVRTLVAAMTLASASILCGCAQPRSIEEGRLGIKSEPLQVGRYALVIVPPSYPTNDVGAFKVDTVTGDVWFLNARKRWRIVETDSVGNASSRVTN